MAVSETIRKMRPPKNRVDPLLPYNYLHEKEPDGTGQVRPVNTLFLANRECSFRCLMCDLWKNTTDHAVPPGAIPAQIRYALDRLPPASCIKLYNNGNFFDRKSIPPREHASILREVGAIDRLIVENHPSLCDKRVMEFAQTFRGKLEVAMGLETIHPDVLPKLNKQMSAEEFRRAVLSMRDTGIESRAFVLLNPPYLTGTAENREWCLRSLRYAFDSGVSLCTIIPVRTGNGIMESLLRQGNYRPPSLAEIERVFEAALLEFDNTVLLDLWDLERFSECEICLESVKERLHRMNLTQQPLPAVECDCRSGGKL